MNKRFLHIIILLLCTYHSSRSQENTPLGYKIEGDEVIFTFDVRAYEKATKDTSGKQLDFRELDIYDVAVSGEFNNWSRERWKMQKTGTYTYVLRKKMSDLSDSGPWEFKFVINKEYWAEPGTDAPNIVRAKKDDFWLNVYNLKLYPAAPARDGNAYFCLNGHPEARNVILTGTFNRWNEEAFPMKKTSAGWELTLQLNPGQYEYKFIVDGKWTHDPRNPEKRRNRFLTYNSLLSITKPVRFTLKGYEDAGNVILSGSFNNWDTKSIVMSCTNEGWSATVPLTDGKVHYKYIVDGKWITDPANPVKEHDGKGHINSVKFIE